MGYDGHCRELTDEQVAAFEAEGRAAGRPVPDARRRRSPSTTWSAARSPSRPSTCPTSRSCRANGDPLYTLVNPVDDALMEITHVLRGEDLLSSTPRQIALYDALAEIGVGDGARRSSATCPTSWARATRSCPSATPRRTCSATATHGFLPEGLLNYLALLGWAIAADRDVFTLDEMVEAFDIARRQPQPGALRPQEGRGDQRRPHAAALARGHDRAGAAVPPARRRRRRPGHRRAARRCSSAAMPLVAERINKLTEAVGHARLPVRRRGRRSTATPPTSRSCSTTTGSTVVQAAHDALVGARRRGPPRRSRRRCAPQLVDGARAQAAQRVRPGPGRRHRPPDLAAAVRVAGAARPRAQPGPAAERAG